MKTPSHTNIGPKTRVAWWQVECERPRVRCDGEVCAAVGGTCYDLPLGVCSRAREHCDDCASAPRWT